jgi:hypothetical protein
MNQGQDETNHFTGYNFTFTGTGAVTATNGAVNATGSWGAQFDDGVSKVVLYFTTPFDFQDLSDDWNVGCKRRKRGFIDAHLRAQLMPTCRCGWKRPAPRSSAGPHG